MKKNIIYDIVGIGIGPFNLGLAALCSTIPRLRCLFIDQNDFFNWHPGLLLDTARLQVPFFADLVTLADPCNPFSYMAFLKAKQRMFRFGIHENYFVSRKEYNQYCQWVVSGLPSLQFGVRCDAVSYTANENLYRVTAGKETFLSKNIVIGTGTVPFIPFFAEHITHPLVFHSAEYLPRKEILLRQKTIAIVGSGQSAAEIFYDLLQDRCFTGHISWFTRSERFFPMDYSKLTLEMTSPDYVDHFYSLDTATKQKVISRQAMLYKGVNYSLIGEIYDSLYQHSMDHSETRFHLHPNAELKEIEMIEDNQFQLKFEHLEMHQCFKHEAEAVIFATGYRNLIPSFLRGVKEHILWTNNGLYKVNRNYSIDPNNSIFIQNAETHTHGFNAADLGMGPYRNSIIVNTILGYEHFSIEEKITFQTFGIRQK